MKDSSFSLVALEITSLSMDISTVYTITNNSSSPKGTMIIDLGRNLPQEVMDPSPQMRNLNGDIP